MISKVRFLLYPEGNGAIHYFNENGRRIDTHFFDDYITVTNIYSYYRETTTNVELEVIQ